MYALVTLTSVLALAAATPLKRSCNYIYPNLVGILDSATPDVPFPPLSSVDSGATGKGAFRVTAVQFALLPGTVGPCALEFNFDPAAQITTTGRTSLGVYKTAPRNNHPDSFFHLDDTWNKSPAIGFQWGSFNPAPGGKGTINTETCQQTMSYYVSAYEPWIINGGGASFGKVSFQQVSVPPNPSGLRLRVGC